MSESHSEAWIFHTSCATKWQIKLYAESCSNQWFAAFCAGTIETRLVPMKFLPADRFFIRVYSSLTILAFFSIIPVITLQTQWHIGLIIGCVLFSSQRCVAVITAKMLDMEAWSLSWRVFLTPNNLIACSTSFEIQYFGQISTTVNIPLVIEIN